LEELREQNVSTLKGLWDRVRTLWDRVETTDEEREAFKSQNSGISQRVILAVSIAFDLHFNRPLINLIN